MADEYLPCRHTQFWLCFKRVPVAAWRRCNPVARSTAAELVRTSGPYPSHPGSIPGGLAGCHPVARSTTVELVRTSGPHPSHPGSIPDGLAGHWDSNLGSSVKGRVAQAAGLWRSGILNCGFINLQLATSVGSTHVLYKVSLLSAHAMAA